MLAVAPELEKAAVLKGEVRTAVVDRAVAQAFALNDWIAVEQPGRVTTYRITAAEAPDTPAVTPPPPPTPTPPVTPSVPGSPAAGTLWEAVMTWLRQVFGAP